MIRLTVSRASRFVAMAASGTGQYGGVTNRLLLAFRAVELRPLTGTAKNLGEAIKPALQILQNPLVDLILSMAGPHHIVCLLPQRIGVFKPGGLNESRGPKEEEP